MAQRSRQVLKFFKYPVVMDRVDRAAIRVWGIWAFKKIYFENDKETIFKKIFKHYNRDIL